MDYPCIPNAGAHTKNWTDCDTSERRRRPSNAEQSRSERPYICNGSQNLPTNASQFDGPDFSESVERRPSGLPVAPIHNSYGMFREYQGAFPTYDPESSTHLRQLCDSLDLEHGEDEDNMYPRFGTSLRAVRDNYFKPFLNATVW